MKRFFLNAGIIFLSFPLNAQLSVTVTTTPDCNNLCLGTATANATGGVQPYSYLWSTGGTSPLAAGLCVGAYTVTVMDDNNDMVIGNAVIVVGSFAFTTSSIDVSCSDSCDGIAYTTVWCGTPPYTYAWNDPFSQTTDTAAGLCAGTYTVTVTDSLGQNYSAIVIMYEPSPLTAAVASNAATQGCNGNATVIPSGGTPGYTYQWNAAAGNQTTATANSLCAGNYCVTITDINFCTFDTCVTVVAVGMKEIVAQIPLNVYPNPSTGQFTVELSSSEVSVFLTDMMGKVIWKEENVTNNSFTIDISTQPKGIYFIRVQQVYPVGRNDHIGGEQIFTEKLIHQ